MRKNKKKIDNEIKFIKMKRREKVKSRKKNKQK